MVELPPEALTVMSTAAVDTTQAAAATATLRATILTYLSEVEEIVDEDIMAICILSAISADILSSNCTADVARIDAEKRLIHLIHVSYRPCQVYEALRSESSLDGRSRGDVVRSCRACKYLPVPCRSSCSPHSVDRHLQERHIKVRSMRDVVLDVIRWQLGCA